MPIVASPAEFVLASVGGSVGCILLCSSRASATVPVQAACTVYSVKINVYSKLLSPHLLFRVILRRSP